jgi:hypothetical protein
MTVRQFTKIRNRNAATQAFQFVRVTKEHGQDSIIGRKLIMGWLQYSIRGGPMPAPGFLFFFLTNGASLL